jgi:hypothetical protein
VGKTHDQPTDPTGAAARDSAERMVGRRMALTLCGWTSYERQGREGWIAPNTHRESPNGHYTPNEAWEKQRLERQDLHENPRFGTGYAQRQGLNLCLGCGRIGSCACPPNAKPSDGEKKP